MTRLSIAEIVDAVAKAKTNADKVTILKRNDNAALRTVLAVIYDKEHYEWYFPKSVPEYKPSVISESHGLLYREIRKMQYFLKGYSGDNLNPIRREALFIQMMESIDANDAKIMEHCLLQRPIKGITKAVVEEAYPNLFIKKKERSDAS